VKVKLLGQCLAFVSESIGRDALYGRGETVSLTVDRSTAPKPGMWVGGGSITRNRYVARTLSDLALLRLGR